MNNQKPVPSLAECLEAADETREMRIKKDCLGDIPGMLEKFEGCRSVFLAADGNTWEAAGKKVKESLDGAGIPVTGTLIFPAEPRLHADYAHIQTLVEKMSPLKDQGQIPAAIGSGTINDLVKRAAFELKIPYLCVPTAASVDGYTAFGAAILVEGFKQTLPCTAPLVVAADTEVLAGAPAYLSSSGFGDLASKIIAGSDWIIADKAGKLGAPKADAIDDKAWAMTQHGLREYLRRAVNSARGDADGVNALFEALAITGLSMQYFKTSRPVSGAEHLFSHVWEMEDLSINGVPVTHGHKVTIGTLAATAFTEIFFADPEGPPAVPRDYRRPTPSERMTEVSAAFRGSRGHDGVVKTALEKMADEKTVEAVNGAFRDGWKDIRGKVLAQILPYGELRALLENAGCPLRPETVNLTRGYAIATARRAQMIRNKYSILDIAWDMGCFETILATMEASETYLR
ncbi:MAG: sn-glycerol-1-phosphate dehydrogenase [Treponema sp.]|jgi:glycerol-1-phosphate dehydrogenase [NAD(P)+]|nr:sn-glycerol-1-phosphate dehydrogenase [Treponema sp.]